MEDWQKLQIQKNLPSLIEITTCTSKLLAILRAKGIVGCDDVANIKARKTKVDKTYLLYDILCTRKDAYYTLIHSLIETNQSGAVDILLKQLPNEMFENLQINFLGNVSSLKTLLDPAQIVRILSWVQNHMSTKEFLEFHENVLCQNNVVKLIRNTMPPPYSLYIPRFLSRRLKINISLFEQPCTDVFVFKDISRLELRNFMKSYGIETSTKQLLSRKITSRFVLLDSESDWKKICEILPNSSVHLVRFEKATHAFILQATTGRSSYLHEYLEHSGQLENILIPENSFVEAALKDNEKGICICDSPGMGKSLLLENLARQTFQKHPDRIVVFMQLRDLAPSCTLETTCSKEAILNQLATSSLAYRILREITQNLQIKFELFLDGLDEVSEDNLESVTNLLHDIGRSMPEARTYVTSRLVLRSELEQTLGTIPYDIHPFSKETQIYFLVSYWTKNDRTLDTLKLTEFASKCLQHLEYTITDGEKMITGIPLQCRLVAEIYSMQASVYADKRRTSTPNFSYSFASSLVEIYGKYLQIQLGDTDCNFECVLKNKTKCTESCLVRSFHVWYALMTIFPEVCIYIFKFQRQMQMLQLNTHNILRPGILLQKENGSYKNFVHQTFAEYLVAEYFVKRVFVINTRETLLEKNVKNILFNKFFISHRNYIILAEYGFRKNVVVTFLNSLILKNGFIPDVPFVLKSGYRFTRALVSCLYHNYTELFELCTRIAINSGMITRWRHKYYLQKNKYRAVMIAKIAVKHCSVSTVAKVFEFFSQFYGVHLNTLDSNYLIDHYVDETLLQIAVRQSNYEMVCYLAELLPIHNQNLIYTCVYNTENMTTEQRERRLEIAQLLLSKCSDLVTEKTGLLLALEAHVDAIILLVNNGANYRVTKGYKNILHLTIEYMSDCDFIKLCDFLIYKCNARELFLEDANWFSFFDLSFLDRVEIKVKTLVSILIMLYIKPGNVCESLVEPENSLEILIQRLTSQFYLEYKEGFTTLLWLALKEKNLDVIKLLVSYDSSIAEVKNDIDTTFLCMATMHKLRDITELMICKGANFYAVNLCGETILHFAAETKDSVFFHWLVEFLGRMKEKDNKSQSNALNCKSKAHFEPKTLHELFNWRDKLLNRTALDAAIEYMELSRETLELYFTYSNTTQK